LTLVVGCVASMVLGGIYGYAIHIVPRFIFKAGLTFAYGLFVGALVGAAAKKGSIRNLRVTVLLSVVVGAFAVMMAWFSWIHAVTGADHLMIAVDELSAGLRESVDTMTLDYFESSPTEWLFYAFWTIEALFILGLIVAFGHSSIYQDPFCESCKRWVDTTHLVGPLEPIDSPASLKEALEAESYEALIQLKFVDETTRSFTKIHLHQCTGCRQRQYLSVEQVKREADGSEKMIGEIPINCLAVSEKQYERLLMHWQQTAADSVPADL